MLQIPTLSLPQQKLEAPPPLHTHTHTATMDSGHRTRRSLRAHTTLGCCREPLQTRVKGGQRSLSLLPILMGSEGKFNPGAISHTPRTGASPWLPPQGSTQGQYQPCSMWLRGP